MTRARLGLARLPAGVAGDRLGGGEGGDQGDPLLLHQGQELVGDVRAVLDRRRPRPARRGGSPPRCRRGRRPGARAPRLVHRGGHLLLREGGRRDARPAAVVGVDLDPVGTGGDLLAHGLAHLDRPVDHLRPLRDLPARIEAGRAVGAGGDQGAGGGEDARSRDHALRDRVPQDTSAKPAPSVPRSRTVVNPASSVASGRHHGADRPQLERLLEHLVVPGGLVVGVEEEMRVHLDQAGDQGQPREVDLPRSGRRLEGAGGADRGDPAVLDQHVAAVEQAVAGGIEDPRAGQQEGSRCRRRGEGQRRQERGSRSPRRALFNGSPLRIEEVERQRLQGSGDGGEDPPRRQQADHREHRLAQEVVEAPRPCRRP